MATRSIWVKNAINDKNHTRCAKKTTVSQKRPYEIKILEKAVDVKHEEEKKRYLE